MANQGQTQQSNIVNNDGANNQAFNNQATGGNGNFTPASAWLNNDIRVPLWNEDGTPVLVQSMYKCKTTEKMLPVLRPLFDADNNPIMVKDDKGKDTDIQQTGCQYRQDYKLLSIGGMPISAKGLKRVPVSEKARTGDEKEQRYYAYATESNAAMQQIEDHIKTLGPKDTYRLPYTLETEIRIPGVNSGPPVASTNPLSFD